VSERGIDGKIHWQAIAPTYVYAATRLPGGETLTLTRNQLIEVDKNGKQTVRFTRAQGDMRAVRRGRDGQIVIAALSACLWLDASFKEIRSFPIGPIYSTGAKIEVLPGGRVLVPQYSQHKVVEYDQNGKVVWEAAVPQPTAAQRLPNGHTLVVGQLQQQLLELDRSGKEVSRMPGQGRITQAYRR
jgi:hypothetical protein